MKIIDHSLTLSCMDCGKGTTYSTKTATFYWPWTKSKIMQSWREDGGFIKFYKEIRKWIILCHKCKHKKKDWFAFINE